MEGAVAFIVGALLAAVISAVVTYLYLDRGAKSRVRLSAVSPRCPVCKSNTWIMVNVGPANVIAGTKPVRQRCCVFCLSQGKVTTW